MFEYELENEESGVSRTEGSKASGDDEWSFEDAKDEIQPSSSWTNYFLSIIEIWSVDVAKIAQHNNGVKYLLVAVDVVSRYLRRQPMKALYAKEAVEAFKNDQTEKTRKGLDRQGIRV